MENNKQLPEKRSSISLKAKNFDVIEFSMSYIDLLRMFFGYFNVIPNLKVIESIDSSKIKIWFDEKYKSQILKQHYRHDFDANKMAFVITKQYYVLENSIIVKIEYNTASFAFMPEVEDKIDILLEEIKKFIKTPKLTTDISLIVVLAGIITTKELYIKKPKINFNIHYNSDFTTIHKNIVRQLNKSYSKGLYLFHGLPGTGKSTYIKYLIHQLKKKVIFLSPKMAGELDNLNMTSFLIDNRNSVLVIEDAEELISSRDDMRNSNLSMLLNLTDGILGESLGIQIIATFNTDLKNIDKALLRKGRLTSIYEFKYLAVDKTNDLLKSLGHNIEVTTPLPLAEIFNFDINNNYEPKLKKAVGFGN